MTTARTNKYEWHYNQVYGLAGLLVAAALIVGMRDDLEQGLILTVAITAGTGWIPRRVDSSPTEQIPNS